MRRVVWLVVGTLCGWTWARAVLASRAGPPGISTRQGEILDLVARGMTTKQIATAAGISEHSVRTHIRRATRTLGVSTRAAAVAALRSPQAVAAPARPRRSATRSRAVTISPTSSSNGT